MNFSQLRFAYVWSIRYGGVFVVIAVIAAVLRFAVALHHARAKFRRLQALGIPIMTHSLLFGHLPVVRQFYQDWASDANFIQTFGYYISKHWQKYFTNETKCPPVVYIDVWPIATPMAFSLQAYVSNQIEIGQSLPKSPMQGEFLRPISNGRDLNCMHGEEWRMWRSRFNPGFSKSSIRNWIPALLDEVEVFAQVLRRHAGEDGDWGPVFQLEKMSGDLAFDATGRIVVNTSLNSQTSTPARFSSLYREQLSHMEITLSPRKLLWRATPMFKWAVTRRREELFQLLRPFILKSIETEHQDPSTILHTAITEIKGESKKAGKELPSTADDALVMQVFCQLMIFFFGGDDAISIIIPWMIKHLAANKECIQKLRAEHDAILGTDVSLASTKIRESPHILDSLQYTNGVIKETLRLNPATITIREGQPDFKLTITDSNVPWPTDGFDLFDSSITVHRDEANFPHPMRFMPERFVVSAGHELHPPKNVWRGFQLGPRQCIGQEMAIVVLKLVLVKMVREFDVELAWDEWDQQQKRQGLHVAPQLVEGERMYTTGKATSHPKDGAPAHVRIRD